jgi:hypothetical protein
MGHLISNLQIYLQLDVVESNYARLQDKVAAAQVRTNKRGHILHKSSMHVHQMGSDVRGLYAHTALHSDIHYISNSAMSACGCCCTVQLLVLQDCVEAEHVQVEHAHAMPHCQV